MIMSANDTRASFASPAVGLQVYRWAVGPGRMAERWSQAVTERSHALDLEPGVFTWDDPRKIAASLKLAAENSARRQADPYRSAMSLLCFYINRAGKNLPQVQRDRLETAKRELRVLFGKTTG